MNLPNAITFSRLVLTVIFIISTGFSTHAGNVVALVTFVIAAVSDWLDGYLARKLGLVTPLGKLMDPLADKILVCSAFVYFTPEYCPVWATSLIIGREFLVTGLRQIAVEAGKVIAADRLGKWKTGFQLAFCIDGLVWVTLRSFHGLPQPLAFLRDLSRPASEGGWLMPVFLWGAIALTAISGFNYMWSSRDLLKKR